ncbi:MAG: hypothetical protein C4346_03680 [Chloroflexota bacterium]
MAESFPGAGSKERGLGSVAGGMVARRSALCKLMAKMRACFPKREQRQHRLPIWTSPLHGTVDVGEAMRWDVLPHQMVEHWQRCQCSGNA